VGFLAPWMLGGLAAASIPVILHFFYRSRYRTVPWAAMKFLLTSVEQTSRRLRFQELLLLAIRTALLLFLALALARPSSAAHHAGKDGDAVDAVLVLDVSLSMGAREGAKTRLDRAKDGALAVIANLPAHSTAQVVTVADRAALLGPVAASNLEQAKEVVKGVELSAMGTDLLPAAEQALEALGRGHSANKEVYVFTDLQRRGWDSQGAALAAKLRDVGNRAAVYLVRCGTRTPRNVSIVGLAPQSGIPHTGERAGFAVLLRNSGDEAVRDLTVTLEVDGRGQEKESQAVPVVSPGETLAVTLTARLEKAGLRTVTAAVQADELDADNRYSRVLLVRDQARVLVVDGAPSDIRPEGASTFYLMHALRPVPESAWGSYHLQPRSVSATDASAALLGDADACILANVPLQPPGENSPAALSPEFLERLAAFVKEGKGLLVFPGPRMTPELANRAMADEHGLLPLRFAAAKTGTVRPDPGSIDAKSFLAPFREEPLSRLDQTVVQQWVSFEEKPDGPAEVLLRWSDGTAAAVLRKVGAGTSMVLGSAADLKGSDWPLRHTYLPFLHAALARLLGGQADVHNRVAGEPLRWRVPAALASKVHAAIDPAGLRTRLGTAALVDGLSMVALAEAPRAGLWRITADGGDPEGIPFAVTPDARETESYEALTDAQVDERLGFKVHHLTAGDDAGVFSGAERLKREWTLWILAAVLALVLFETGLAWYCGRGW
jgi:hypothetical protein